MILLLRLEMDIVTIILVIQAIPAIIFETGLKPDGSIDVDDLCLNLQIMTWRKTDNKSDWYLNILNYPMSVI